VTKAYSYLRFSTPEQAKGDSFRRQTEAARAYAELHGLDLDESLTFEDLGVSAFRGANVIEGALGQFLAAVDSGRVVKGSVLLVENLDRLSRDKIMPALNRFSALLEKGVIVITLSDGKRYDADSLNNLPDLMLSLLTMARAHDESKIKSQRLAAVWEARRQRAIAEGRAMTSVAPAWLRLVNGKFDLIPERAEIIRRIFRMAIAGHGKSTIARRLTEDETPTFGPSDGWHSAYIYRILTNPAVIGKYQPKVYDSGDRKGRAVGELIDGYFPPVLEDPNDFYRVRRGVSFYGQKPPSNALAGLACCIFCGAAMQYRPGRNVYLRCGARHRGQGCTAPLVAYEVAWRAVHDTMIAGALSLASIMGPREDRQREHESALAAVEAQIAAAEKAIANLVEALEHGPSAALAARLAEQERELGRLHAEREQAAANTPDIGALEAFKLATGMQGGEGIVRLNAELKRLVRRIAVGRTPVVLEWFTDYFSFSDAGENRRIDKILASNGISISVEFRAPDRKLVIFSHALEKNHYIAGWIRESMLSDVKIIP
jgi:DNA invertase Pin-like site-specific DNA recombinase